jgi:hypothetical protein
MITFVTCFMIGKVATSGEHSKDWGCKLDSNHGILGSLL